MSSDLSRRESAVVRADAGAVPAVEFVGVTKRFDAVVAVDRLDLTIRDGEFFSLLGPSGCGKTTTLRMIAGLDFPTEGRLEIHGGDVGTSPPNKRPVNTVFQDYALFPHLNVGDNVGFGLKMQKVGRSEIRDRVGAALELVQLGNLVNRTPNQLSGGQQQRVALARALINRPKVLLLDEPLGALDLKLRQQMQQELKQLQRELGITFVFVTHDQEEALTMSDRIAVLNEGELLQVATPEEIYEQPADRFVAEFIGQTNLLPATIEDAHTVCLANGSRVAIATEQPTGTAVSVLLRPERAHVTKPDSHPAGDDSSDGGRLDGMVVGATYLGNAVVYTIALDWLQIDVRRENRPGGERFDLGDPVTVGWATGAVSVVTG